MDLFSEIIQTLLAGLVMGCVYGLIAFGFVLVFKATEVINFAQGEMMVIGVFFANTLVGLFHLNCWLPLPLTTLALGEAFTSQNFIEAINARTGKWPAISKGQ